MGLATWAAVVPQGSGGIRAYLPVESASALDEPLSEASGRQCGEMGNLRSRLERAVTPD